MNSTPITYIYGLYEPDTMELRYVGKANNPNHRLLCHSTERKVKSHRSHWIQSLKSRGLIPHMRVLELVQDKEWQEVERFWISCSRLAGFNLVNGTEGGEGTSGRSEEFKAKLSKSLKESPLAIAARKRAHQARIGTKYSKQTCERISKARKGNPLTKQHVLNVVAAMKRARQARLDFAHGQLFGHQLKADVATAKAP